MPTILTVALVVLVVALVWLAVEVALTVRGARPCIDAFKKAADDPDEPALAYSALILQAMCDVYEISDEPDITLHLEKEAGDANGR